MAKDFEVQLNAFRIQEGSEDTIASAIETWLDALGIGTDHTIYAIQVFKHQGFLNVIIIYEP